MTVCKRSLKDQSRQERMEQLIAESLAANDTRGMCRLVATLCVPHWQYKIGQQGAVIKAEIATKDISLYTTTKPLATLVMTPQREAC